MYLLYFKRPTEHKTKQLHRQKWNAKMANQKIDVIHDVLTCNKVGMELKPNLWYFLASSTIATFDVNSHCLPPFSPSLPWTGWEEMNTRISLLPLNSRGIVTLTTSVAESADELAPAVSDPLCLFLHTSKDTEPMYIDPAAERKFTNHTHNNRVLPHIDTPSCKVKTQSILQTQLQRE